MTDPALAFAAGLLCAGLGYLWGRHKSRPQWRPMSTAPTERGAEVLALIGDFGVEWVCVARWGGQIWTDEQGHPVCPVAWSPIPGGDS